MFGFDFTGRKILVVGGTSGIGMAIANGFAMAGAAVVAAGLDALSAKVHHPNVRSCELDLRDQHSIHQVVSAFDRLDAVVNAAGIIKRTKEHDPEVFADLLAINLTGAMRLATECRPLLASSRGAVVNIASMLSFFGSGAAPAYSASKGGIVQLTKSLAIAWAKDYIRVNAVAPGWIVTPLTAALADDPSRSDPIIARTPLRRWGTPEDVVGPVLFLCSPAAGFVTGAILPVDGGYLIT